MNYSKIIYHDTGNARGISTVLFVSGCEHHCDGCFNHETWDFEAGDVITQTVIDEVLASIQKPYVRNLVISGGDPLHPNNISTSLRICKEAKQVSPDINVIVYTGYTMAELAETDWIDELRKYVDYIIDGEYIRDLASPILDYRGSINQKAWQNQGGYFKDVSNYYFRYQQF